MLSSKKPASFYCREKQKNSETISRRCLLISISLYFEKLSGDKFELRIFEANTKKQFDRLVKKYKIHYDKENCKYEFDREFFKYNKIYIIHTNYWNEPNARAYKVEKNNGVIDLVIYKSFPMFTTNEVKKGGHGDLLAVSKEFAGDVKEVKVQYKSFEEYEGE